MKLGRLGHPVANDDPLFEIAADLFRSHCRSIWEITGAERFVLAQQAKQDVFGRDHGGAILQCFIACKENDAPGTFGIAFKHRVGVTTTFASFEYYSENPVPYSIGSGLFQIFRIRLM